jgi:GTPase SAR1 family protein
MYCMCHDKLFIFLSFFFKLYNINFNIINSGASFITRKCQLEDYLISFEIWDLTGQERFRSMATMYYRNAHATIVVYDVTKAVSFCYNKIYQLYIKL